MTEFVRPEIPPHLKACAPPPTPPGAGATQRHVALFVLAQREAHADCKAKLSAVVEIIDGPKNEE